MRPPTGRTTSTTTRCTTKPRWKPDDRDGCCPAGVTQVPATVRHAGDPRRPPRPGPRRRTRPPRLPPGSLPGRDHPPGDRRLPTAPAAGEVRAQVTLEEFDFTASSKLPAAQIRDLGALSWLHAGESVILFGPVGVGKTHIAQALGHLAVRQGAHVRFAKTSRILADLAGGHADRTWGN
ncbi:ATP-binding protein [Streptomyces sp. NPDC046316]|uniref:ATP-binding protein n=1 Tax=Streptomyces sp. NPDC046316 TaxID=3154494 RepID=UPI0033ECE983